MNNYDTHQWESRRVESDNGDEYIRVCIDCGIEDIGDPDEFPEIVYPDCAEESDWMS